MTGFIGNIRCSAYERSVRRIMDAEKAVYIYISSFFKCEQTLGFPTSLCVCADQGKAWLMPDESRLAQTSDKKKRKAVMQSFADFGIRDCECRDDLLRLLRELGRDAVMHAFSQDEKLSIFSIMYFGGDPA